MTKTNSMVLAGCGYTGRTLARILTHGGFDVNALVASEGSLRRLVDLGIDSQRWDFDTEQTPPEFPAWFALAYLVPPSPEAITDMRLATCLSHLPDRLEKFVYVSTTGVYGDHCGQRVNEDTAVAPASARATRRVDAENQVQQWCQRHGVPWVILRTPGIYGPGRLPLESIGAQRPIITPEEASPGNRIHRDDLAMILYQALTDNGMQGVFNVGDGNHMTSSEFTLQVSRLAGLAPPPTVSRAQMQQLAGPRRWSFLSESRQVDTARLQQHLQKPLRFADPVEGIRASLENVFER